MGPSLLLSLLLLPASLQAGSSKECNPNTDFGINQPSSLSAPEGGSTCILFSYFHCWELAKDPRLSIAVRRTDFSGEVIYNSTQRFIHKDYKNRISLDLREGQNSGTLCIRNLRKEDENRYFCRVQVETLRDGKKVWQSIPGTKLTITDAAQMTTITKGPTTTVTTTTRDMNMETMVKVALPIAVFKTAILGLVVYLWWKRSKG
ncbi:paired immunoglobulin-like type 2 receptor beta [Neofelis nebulosa]|uniref:paired immunoglobulin-like type 2 receptor beta n=1 Tax=Neofelis nebulosa TaxID=61452 RepID=UPI00272CB45F|nr:paired immunoglobulin-like type 2 receptor beta [Neofelis nebulosa]